MSKVETIYLIHHSHTDIGYTHDQPIVWDLHGRFIDEAVRLARKYTSSTSAGAFRWTVENTGVLYEWLKRASPEQIRQFGQLEHAGRIEVTGMFANLTPLLDIDQLVESFHLLEKLRTDYGFTITSAMNCDVNGENWPLVDLLLDLGIEGFSMAINTHFGGAPLNRPDIFWWQGPSGRKLLAYNGWPYDTGWRFGIGRSEEMLEDWWVRINQRLDEINYPIPALMVQSFHPFGDNGPAYEGFSSFIDTWNAQGRHPQLVLATPRMWWAAVKQHAADLPCYSGDWTDFWNFGSTSSARETTINRGSRVRLRAADLAASATLGLAQPLKTYATARVFKQYREEAWKALNLWDEHTWGADISVSAPESEDTAAQWYHKAHYAYLARSLSLLLQRDALADLARHVQRQNADDLLVFNPLPWTRTISGEVPQHVFSIRGLSDDATSGRHSQDRVWSSDLWVEAARSKEGVLAQSRPGLPPVEVPGFGFALVHRADLLELKPTGFGQAAVVENQRFRLKFDTVTGGVVSFYDKQLQREWFDPSTGYPIHGFVHEEMADHDHPWPRRQMFQIDWGATEVERPRGWKPGWNAIRTRPARVLVHRVYTTPYGERVVQVLEAPGINGQLVQSVFLPQDDPYVEFESWWVMGQSTHPESTYLAFPFDIASPKVRIDLGGESMIAGEDQIPGVCRDYFTVQQWVDLSNDEFGVTISMPDTPLAQFGNFHFGDNQAEFSLERAMLLSWVTNNYWETNFRANQPGGVHARYRVAPHAGGFNPIFAHRAGVEAAWQQPLLQQMGEPADEIVFPAGGALLSMPEQNAPDRSVFSLHVKQARDGNGLVVRLYNAGDQTEEAQVGSGLLQIVSAHLSDLTEHVLQTLTVSSGVVHFQAAPHRVTTLILKVGRTP